MILNVSCDNLTKSKSEDTEESDSKSKKKKKKSADDEEDVAADEENTDDEETSNDDSESRSRNNDDEEEDSDASWTRAEQKQFMESCVENTGFSQSKAESYCECMLNKLQRKYPKAASMENATGLTEEIQAMAPGCLK